MAQTVEISSLVDYPTEGVTAKFMDETARSIISSVLQRISILEQTPSNLVAGEGVTIKNGVISAMPIIKHTVKTVVGNTIDYDEEMINGYAVSLGEGLILDSGSLKVDIGEGLKLYENSIIPNVGTGLKIEDGVIVVGIGDGLTATESGLSVNIGDGLTTEDNKINVKIGSGLKIEDGAISVDDNSKVNAAIYASLGGTVSEVTRLVIRNNNQHPVRVPLTLVQIDSQLVRTIFYIPANEYIDFELREGYSFADTDYVKSGEITLENTISEDELFDYQIESFNHIEFNQFVGVAHRLFSNPILIVKKTADTYVNVAGFSEETTSGLRALYEYFGVKEDILITATTRQCLNLYKAGVNRVSFQVENVDLTSVNYSLQLFVSNGSIRMATFWNDFSDRCDLVEISNDETEGEEEIAEEEVSKEEEQIVEEEIVEDKVSDSESDENLNNE